MRTQERMNGRLKMKRFKNYLIENIQQPLLFVWVFVFYSYCFYYQPPEVVELEVQKSASQTDKTKPVVLMQRSIQSAAGGDKCAEKSEDHPCYRQCKKMYYWKGLDEKECQRDLTIPQINVLEETFDLLWEPEFEELQKIHPNNFTAYLNISNSALSRIIRKYGSKEVEHFMLWVIYNEEITKIFEETDANFKRLTDLLYRVAPYTEQNIYEPFIEGLGSEKLMEAVINSKNETAMELFLRFINHTNRDCSEEAVSRDCFNIYCSIGRAISQDSRWKWSFFESFSFYLSEIVDSQINSQQGQGRDRNPEGWIYKEEGEGLGFSDGDDIDDFVKDLCQGLGHPD